MGKCLRQQAVAYQGAAMPGEREGNRRFGIALQPRVRDFCAWFIRLRVQCVMNGDEHPA